MVNLLPVPPLDMGNIVYAYSPNNYFKLLQNQRYIHSAFILLIALEVLESFGSPILGGVIINMFV